mmetsp:Transcript_144137/g.359337  ORF Transcript_144137/g.359337 Transcript_144137/m.359337 type:complete len:370 (-) Transcript_144137:444-1553(-)
MSGRHHPPRLGGSLLLLSGHHHRHRLGSGLPADLSAGAQPGAGEGAQQPVHHGVIVERKETEDEWPGLPRRENHGFGGRRAMPPQLVRLEGPARWQGRLWVLLPWPHDLREQDGPYEDGPARHRLRDRGMWHGPGPHPPRLGRCRNRDRGRVARRLEGQGPRDDEREHEPRRLVRWVRRAPNRHSHPRGLGEWFRSSKHALSDGHPSCLRDRKRQSGPLLRDRLNLLLRAGPLPRLGLADGRRVQRELGPSDCVVSDCVVLSVLSDYNHDVDHDAAAARGFEAPARRQGLRPSLGGRERADHGHHRIRHLGSINHAARRCAAGALEVRRAVRCGESLGAASNLEDVHGFPARIEGDVGRVLGGSIPEVA